jgi:hypothetical protein
VPAAPAAAAAALFQFLASKLGQAPGALILGIADAVIAHMLWFSLDSLQSFTQFLNDVMHPETFIAVVEVRTRHARGPTRCSWGCLIVPKPLRHLPGATAGALPCHGANT